MFKKIVFKNGLRVILVPQMSTQAVTALVLVGTGSKYENKETNGISHFLEHMFFKGTKKRQTKMEIAEDLDRVGGIYNAFTSQEYTGYFAKVSYSQAELAIDWVSDIFLNSILPRKEVERERGVVIEEINMHKDDPVSYVQTLWSKVLYGDQPAGWDVAGTKESVSNISRDDLLKYMKNQYTASNTVICVAGKINSSRVLKQIKESFSNIDSNAQKSKPKVVERQTDPEAITEDRKTEQTHLCLGVRGYNLFDENRFIQDIISVILGGMMSSRLFMKVREEMGLAYYIKTESAQDTDTGFLVTRAGVDNKNVDRAISAILNEYKIISQVAVPERELKKAKEHAKGKLALELEPSDAKTSFYGIQELLENKIMSPEEIFTAINRVSKKDILRAAKNLFKSEKLNLAAVGPKPDKEKLRELLVL
ncbi:MAG: insulinase family protein [Candidatus Nealsonbacteria bacterium]|nr:insulinase family protein [Candidatus Nealsonbacteria bacterium]